MLEDSTMSGTLMLRLRMPSFVHLRKKRPASTTQTMITPSWKASEALVSLLPSSWMLWVEEGFEVKATPRPFSASTTATRAPKSDMIRLGGKGAQ